MGSWRESVLRHFQCATHRLTLVSDPDGLLQEEQVLAAIRSRDFDVVSFDDPAAFRYAYESQYRSRWDAGEEPALALVVRTGRQDLRHLPYDLLQQGRQVALSLQDLTPHLSYPVVREFFRAAPGLFDRLFDACQSYAGPRLGEERTLAYIARHVYNLDPEAVATLEDLVERLLVVHYNGWPLPERLAGWLSERLRLRCPNLPIGRWLRERNDFFRFLEEEWQGYVTARGLSLAGPRPVYAAGAPHVDFSHPSIRALVDTLFLDGRMRPTRVLAERPPQDWTAVGVAVDGEAYRRERLRQVLEHVEGHLPGPEAGYRIWTALALTWAEALVLAGQVALPAELSGRWTNVREGLDAAFAGWIQARYGALHTLPYLPAPVLGHHVPHFLAHRLRRGTERIALLLLDGLALDQWQVLRETWREQGRPWNCAEGALLAVLPTITPIARQALFAGALPFYFADTWQRTDADGRRWVRFWEEQGLGPGAVAWRLGLEDLGEIVTDPRVRVLGLVVRDVDEMLHGTGHGLGELHDRLRRWAERGPLAEAIEQMLVAGFDLWLTSDHGNVEARGIGQPQEGVLVEKRGARVRFYSDAALLERARAQSPETLAWTPAGLPAGLLTLFAPGRRAFVNQGEVLLAHGGLCLEEVIVPWIHITAEAPGASDR